MANQLWVALKDELRCYTADGALVSGSPVRSIRRIVVDNQGCLWIATVDSIERIDSTGQVLFEVNPFGRSRAHGPIMDLAADSVDCSVWVINKRDLSHVSADGEILSVEGPDPAKRAGLTALALYRDLIPPVISILAPVPESHISTASPLVELSWHDDGSGVDPASLSLTVNESTIEPACASHEAGASCAIENPLPEGANRVRATVRDYEGTASAPAEIEFTVDTIPPTITVTSPEDGLITGQMEQTLTGSLSETAVLTVNGEPVSVGPYHGFSRAITLTEGSNTFLLCAVDRAGNSSSKVLVVMLDTVPPPPVVVDLISIGQVEDGMVEINGTAGSVEAGATVQVRNLRTGETVVVTAGADGSFTCSIGALAGDTIQILAADRAGNLGESASLHVESSGPPPAAEEIPEGSFGDTYRDLVPSDATIERYDSRRFSLITGTVNTTTGGPLAGVIIAILGHPEYGSATTDAQGKFTLPVDGGGNLNVTYTMEGFITSHRQVYVPWNDIAIAETVSLVVEDTASSALTFDGSPDTVLIHRSTEVSDSFGRRSCTLVFSGDNRAYALDAEGNITEELTTITARATEFTTPESMPAKLPPTSAYTYCVELAVDGVERVRFEKPLIAWVDNFLGFDVGEAVPVGYYDRDRGVWVPSDNGRVVRLLDANSDGVVDALDATGDDQPDDLDGDGSFADEADGLHDPLKYPAGATFWRVVIDHFSPWDLNWPCGPPADAINPNPEGVAEVDQQKCNGEDCKSPFGSYVEERARILHQDIPIAGTKLSLHYASNRVQGYRQAIHVPASGSAVPESLRRIVVKLQVASRTFQKVLDPMPNQKAGFQWDGLDHLGRPVAGRTTAHVRIGFVYNVVYYGAGPFEPAFAQPGAQATGIVARSEITFWKRAELAVDAQRQAVSRGGGEFAEGWTLSAHHQLDPTDPSVLRKGDGTSTNNDITRIVTTIAGNGSYGYSGDGGPAVEAELSYPIGVEVDAAGNVYIADWTNNRIRKVGANGIITTIAGNGLYGYSGDGGPATQAELDGPYDVAVDAAGNVYIADAGNQRVRKVDTGGIITTIAGIGWGFSGDGGPATEARLNGPLAVAVDTGGNVYIADSYNRRIRKVGTNGIITTIAGNGASGYSGDGGPATEAMLSQPEDVTTDAAGNVYIADRANHRIRKVDTQGIITTVAGIGVPGYGGDGGPATETKLYYPCGIVVDATGTVYIADSYNNRIRKVDADGVITTIAGGGTSGSSGDGGPARAAKLGGPSGITVDAAANLYISEGSSRIRKVGPHSGFAASMIAEGSAHIAYAEESGLGHLFSRSERHIRTVDLNTGVTLYELGYDESGRLISVADTFGEMLAVERDTNGVPTAFVSPDGMRTGLSVDSNGQLIRITYPDGGNLDLEYAPGGLLTAKIEPEGNRYEYAFDEGERLTEVRDPEGGSRRYARLTRENGDVLTERLTGEGNLTTYLDHTSSTGAYTSVITDPTGAETLFSRSFDGLSVAKSFACGMSAAFEYGIDSQYHFPYVKQTTESTPSGLSRTTLHEKTYEDVDGDDTPDLITRKVTVNGKPSTELLDTLQSRRILTSPSGRAITSFHDPSNLLTTKVAIPELHETTFGYDAKGRPTAARTNTRETTFTYDAQGNLSSATDPERHTTIYSHDPVGRMTGMTRPDGTSLAFAYDQNGNMTVLTNPSSIEHGFDYNRVNRNSAYHAPTSGSYAYTYDKDRRLTAIQFPSGREIRNIYDKTRLTTIETPEGEIELSYLCGSKVGSVAKGDETISYSYDGSLPISEALTGTLAQSLAYTYDNDFRLSQMSYAGESVSNAYDGDGLLTGSGMFIITRKASNGLPEAVTGGGSSLSRSFNGYGEMDGEALSVSDIAVSSWTLARDNAGRIISKTEVVDGVTSELAYTYDPLGRLLAVTKDGLPVEEYQYGPNGGRIHEKNTLRAIASRSMDYSEEDHLLTAGAVTYQYDLDGFLTTKTDGDRTTHYTYSSRGELLGVTLPDGRVIEYVHDPLGRRIAKKVNGNVTEKYLWQGMTKLLAVFDGTNTLLMRFHYADARMPLAMSKEGATYHLSYDQMGSLILIADSSGNTIKRIDHDSFGNILLDTNPSFSIPFGFAGGLFDPDTGLVRFGYRDYDPDLGRWTAKDPIGFNGSDTNLYGYCLGDPINNIDPDGKIGVLAAIGIGIAVAAVSYYAWDFAKNIMKAGEIVDQNREARKRYDDACMLNDVQAMEEADLDYKENVSEGLSHLEKAAVDGAHMEYTIGRQLHRGGTSPLR